DAGVPMTYTSSPYTMSGGYTYPSMPAATYMPATSGLDHSQGKWFAPGEALPPGFVITTHPEGHTAPQETHAMTDKARESFVVTGSSLPKAAAPVKKSKKVMANRIHLFRPTEVPVKELGRGLSRFAQHMANPCMASVPAEPMYTTMPAYTTDPAAAAPVYTTMPADAMPAYTIQQDAGVPVTYTASPYTMSGGYTYPSMPAATYMPAMSGLDHSQGKWFAPGE
ncbi:unnamed protein product, partial [Symbiodinium microadriaticum]